MSLSEYDLDVFHVPGKDLAIADGLSRIVEYPSRLTTEEETVMASFTTEEAPGYQVITGSHTNPSGEVDLSGNSKS